MEQVPPPKTSTQPATITRTNPLPPYTILEPTDTNITKTISAICHAFIETPLLLTFLIEADNLPTSTSVSHITQSRRLAYYTDPVTSECKAGAILTESGNFSAVAIWEPPTFKGVEFTSGRKNWTPSSIEWTRKVKVTKLKYLGDPDAENPTADEVTHLSKLNLRPHWHFAFLVRNPEVERVPGAVSAVTVPFLERARQEKVPVWLEATTQYGVKLYEYFGFRLVDTITVGRGVYGDHGWFEEGGPGSTGYCMIYDEHLTGK